VPELREADTPGSLQVREVLRELVPRGVQQRQAARYQARREEENGAVTFVVGFLVIASVGVIIAAMAVRQIEVNSVEKMWSDCVDKARDRTGKS
jgi:hypothetical protein